MKPLLAVVLFISIGVSAIGQDKAEWTVRMQKLSVILRELLPNLVSQERFDDPKNKLKIEKQAKELADMSHFINIKNAKDLDPSLRLIAKDFKATTRTGFQSLRAGFREVGRDQMLSAINHCVACHSRTSGGPRMDFTLPDSVKLHSLDKARIYIGLRNYDLAMKSLNEAIADRRLQKSEPVAWERAVQKALLVAIRVKEDYDLALDVLKSARKAEDRTSYYFQLYAEIWQDVLASWKKEKPSKDRLTLARNLVKAGGEIQETPLDQRGFIHFLRASKVLHSYLKKAKNKKKKAEALYLLGICYENLYQLELWDLPEQYFQACIEVAPKSKQAKRCYTQYEQSVLANAVGASKSRITESAKDRLKKLKRKAF